MAEETPEQKKERRETILAIITMGAIFLLFEVGVIAWAGRIKKHDEKKLQINAQVGAYEKTLPADYLEYKQAVEHYRDSLMHAKGR